MRASGHFLAGALACLATGCVTTAPVDLADGALCASKDLFVYVDFSGANAESCTIHNKKLSVVIQPEATPVNTSAWYAFRVKAYRDESIKVTLRYPGFAHRYAPKLSTDRQSWTRISPEQVNVSRGGGKAKFSIDVEGGVSTFVAAEELFTYQDYIDWATSVAAAHPFVEESTFGRSPDGRELIALTASSPSATETVVLVGRQHPPEVSGAIGLLAFTDVVFGDSDLAKEFRDRYKVFVAPVLNPDGVERGHWRLNTGGIDLNRDWGPFTQAESQAIRNELVRRDATAPIALFLDFHSTHKNVFYTQADEAKTQPPAFSARWAAAIEARSAPIPFSRQPGADDGKTTSKAFVFNTYGVAATTVEFYEDENREGIREFAATAAEEMMKIMLEETPDNVQASR